ncbi:MAG: phospholipid carrier-dependent glycosyltransferase [Clostridiales bacterium]|nr:phospholipid carrier-dependent glycosyltransferase [Clostridiales bacterium]
MTSPSRKVNTEQCRMLFLYFFTWVILSLAYCFLNVPCIIDETVTMANAALLSGRNWSEFIRSMANNYYRYGQAILNLPFMYIADPYLRYKLMLVLNAAVVATCPVMAYSLCRRRVQDPVLAMLISLASVFLPGVGLYSSFERADYLLITLAWLTIYAFTKAYESRNHPKRQAAFSLLTAAACCCAYASHTRGIVYIVAVVFTVLLIQFTRKERAVHYWSFILSLIVLLLVDRQISACFKSRLWSGGERRASLDTVSLEDLKLVFTGDGIKILIRMLAGWTTAFVGGTMGFGLLGGTLTVGDSISLMRSKSEDPQRDAFSLLTLLLLLGSYAMGIAFLFTHVPENPGREDFFIYERYLVAAFGPILLVSLSRLTDSKRRISTKQFWLVLVITALLIGAFSYLMRPELAGSVDNYLGLLPFSRFTEKLPMYTFFWLYKGAVFLDMFIGILLLLAAIGWGKKHSRSIVSVILAISLVFFGLSFATHRLEVDAAKRKTTEYSASQIHQIAETLQDEPIVAIHPSISSFTQTYQFLLKDHTVSKQQPSDWKDTLVICHPSAIVSIQETNRVYFFANEKYDETNSDMVVLVHGEAMKAKLEAYGYELLTDKP